MNIFAGKTVYGEPWHVSNTRVMEPSEVAQFSQAEVVASKRFEDQKSVCFHMVAGGTIFIPLSNQSKLGVGDSLDLKKPIQVITLERSGDAPIDRIDQF